MKFLKTYKIFEMAAMPSGMPKTYYHGCSNQVAGEKILEEGILKPGNTEKVRGPKLMPMMNYVYCTPDETTACVYTIGGVFMGSKLTDSMIEKDGRYGYCFEIDSSDLGDVMPDEDFLGELIWYIEKKPSYMEGLMWDKSYSWVHDNPEQVKNYLSFAKSVLTPLQYQKCVKYDDYADFAVAGKKLNKYITPEMARMIVALGCPVANKGPLKISGAWKLDKTRTEEIDNRDAENFFEIAERVK